MSMKSLLLLRHAKSSWDHRSLVDFDRPLDERGRGDAPRMGAELASCGWLPDTVLVSPAARTRETWTLMADALGASTQVQFCKPLYEASADRILAEIRKTSPSCRTLMVVGHNPGLEMLANLLAGPSSGPEPLSRLAQKYPTAGVARLAFEGDWSRLAWEGATLTDFLRPKDLR
jgi:phosphohistidine phosphatase